LFENYLIKKVDAYDEYLQNVIDREKVIATYDALKHNAK
jgi:mannitol/fructose-specific phosphotransferase system IIA component